MQPGGLKGGEGEGAGLLETLKGSDKAWKISPLENGRDRYEMGLM